MSVQPAKAQTMADIFFPEANQTLREMGMPAATLMCMGESISYRGNVPYYKEYCINAQKVRHYF